jgi:hypothetical protein
MSFWILRQPSQVFAFVDAHDRILRTGPQIDCIQTIGGREMGDCEKEKKQTCETEKKEVCETEKKQSCETEKKETCKPEGSCSK